jgi:hypothetical protein
MAERKVTGGSREFRYRKEDLERIRSTDTGSTKEFKDAYRKWEVKKEEEKIEKELKRQRVRLVMIAVILTMLLIILLSLKFMR